MQVRLTKPQTDFFTSDAKYTAAVAGFGSGKTQGAITRLISNMLESPGIHQAYLAPTYPLIRDIFYPKVDEYLTSIGLSYKINKAEHTVSVQGLGTVFCRTMEKPESIVGWEVADAFLDEFDVLRTDKALDVFRKISARLRQPNPVGRKNQLFITTTPEGFKATYQLFKKDPLPNSNLIQMSTYSNAKNLPEDYIQDLMDQYPAQLIEAYLNGMFVNLTSGTVYYAFDRKLHNTHYVVKPREHLLIGMDFNVNDMCATVHIRRSGILYAVGELFGIRDTPDMCDVIKETYPDHKVTVYPDASGRGTTSKSASVSDIKILKGAGFQIKARTKNPFIKDRVNCMNAAFEKQHYFVNIQQCPEYAEALEQQVYNEKTGQPMKDGTLDNRVDGAGYLVHILLPIVKQNLAPRKLGGF